MELSAINQEEKVSNKTARESHKRLQRTSDQFYLPSASIYRRQLAPFKEECEEDGECHTKDDREADEQFIAEFDEISTGLPSDLPSDMFDIEGNLVYGNINHLRFGLEEEEFSSNDEGDYPKGKRAFSKKAHQQKQSKTKPITTTCSSPKLNVSFEEAGDINDILQCDKSKEKPNLFQFHHPSPHYQLVGKRSLSKTSSSSTGLKSSSSGGNFSPPSDQFRSPLAPFDRHHSSGGGSSSNHSSSTITQHYYPEGGWGYVILVTCMICHVLTCGFQLSFCILWNAIPEQFGSEVQLVSCWLGAVSLGISLLFSPIWVSICKKKSTRLSAVFGGLVASLGCLFTSFASQFHQTFISYGAFLGVGVGLTRDASSLMVGQYFKRKRELVEIIVVSGSGLGIILMSIVVHTAIGSLGWRLGLQAVTVSLILTFFLGTCYRSASLYHPQRRAILHLKNQKRKVKEKGKREDKPPFIDCSCLRSKTLRIILMSSACTAFGIFTPLLSLAVQCSKKGFEDCSLLFLHIYIGFAWIIGCCTLGLVVIQKSQDCRVSKQYLCQVTSVICGISILALTAVKGTNGMVVFSWVYGASLGGYCYSLKVYTYERARARHFPRAWSFLQSSQAIPLFFGVPLTNYANEIVGWKSGYYMSALAVFLGTACLFLTDVRRRKLSRRKSQNSSMKTCETTDGGTSSPKSKRLSFAFPVDQQLPPQSKHDSDSDDEPGGNIDPSVMLKELTCISEEGLADLDFQDIYFDEWAEYIGECITSCNKVENCLVSEYDPDLMIMERRARRWSAAKQNQQMHSCTGPGGASKTARLTLPGIGTVLEVPLLVAKRLHPGARSHPRQVQQKAFQEECNLRGCSDCTGASGNPATTRIYHHGKARSNAPQHFPAIDEDSV